MKVSIKNLILMLSIVATTYVIPQETNSEDNDIKQLHRRINQNKKNDEYRKKRVEKLNAKYSTATAKETHTAEPPKTLLDEWNKSLDFCKRNALYIFTAVGFYFTFYFIKHKIVQATNYLSQPTLWSSWRNDLSFNSLVSIPKETLTQWIVEDIQDHYHDDHSIKLFYKDVQAEQAQLQEIKNLYEKLDFFYMIDDQALVDVKTRLKVLGLLKDLVLMWELEQALAVQTALNSSSVPQT